MDTRSSRAAMPGIASIQNAERTKKSTQLLLGIICSVGYQYVTPSYLLKVVQLLTSAFARLGKDKNVSAVILKSEGTGFSAGDDLMGKPPTQVPTLAYKMK